MSEARDVYTKANRTAWNASADFHRAGEEFKELLAGFAKPGYSCLDGIMTAALEEIGVAGKDVAQICCNNARELLSIKNMGAARCVGFDQAEKFLEQGRELAAVAGQEMELVAGDIYALDGRYDGAFDRVVVTIGVFGWMPDLEAFMAIPARLLKPGGALFVYEQHPIVDCYEPDAPDPHKAVNSYFKDEPFEDEGGIVYDGSEADIDVKHYWFIPRLDKVIGGLLRNGLVIEAFREYPHNISSVEFDIFENQPAQMPMSYTLVARKPL